MNERDKKLEAIIGWARENEDVVTVLLTSSLVNPLAPVDAFSDLDIELVFRDNVPYVSDNAWLSNFGTPISMIEEDERCFEGRHAMKMVLYSDYVKVDFKLYNAAKFIEDTQAESLPEDWDIGYTILIDKDKLTKHLQVPSYQASIIKKPTEARFIQLVNDFWWDTAYVAKCLARNEIFYAKFVSENVIRTDYLVPLIEWYIAAGHNWKVTTNKHGRLFKKYLSPELWKKVELTFSGSDIEDNWSALFAFADLVKELSLFLSRESGYPYPFEQTETDMRKYLNDIHKRYSSAR